MLKISDERLKTVCLIGQGEKTCAFIVCGPDGFECAKGTSLEPHIQMRLFVDDMNAKGDNCDGVNAVGQ